MPNSLRMNVVNSNDISLLSALCSKVIKELNVEGINNPFYTEKIVVMNKGMQTYLQQEFATDIGVCAGMDFEQVWQFIWNLHKKINGADAFNRFDHEHLTWALLAIIDELKEKYKDEASSKEQVHDFQADMFKKIKDYLCDSDDKTDRSAKQYMLCGVIADALDQYQMYRPDWIKAWDSKDELNESNFNQVISDWIDIECKKNEKKQKTIKETLKKNQWQAWLWMLIKKRIAHLANPSKESCKDGTKTLHPSFFDRAQVVESLIKQLKDNATDTVFRNKLPKRVFIYGVTALPTQVIDLFVALGKVIPVFFLNLNPCQEYWGDLNSQNSKWKAEKEQIVNFLRAKALEDNNENFKLKNVDLSSKYHFTDELKLENEDAYYNSYMSLFEDDELVDGNPLLISLGRQGRDTLNELVSRDDVDVTNLFIENSSDNKSVLNCLKDDLLTLNTSKNSERHVIEKGDRSFQIRSCHTVKRELETLRDEILSLFKKENNETQKNVYPKDILVMVPNIEDYAPYIESVFGSLSYDDPNYLPYSICDKTAKTSSKIADAVLKLLTIGEIKIAASTVVELLSVEPLAQKFEITPDDLNVIISWFKDAGIHWGIDNTDVFQVLDLHETNSSNKTKNVKTIVGDDSEPKESIKSEDDSVIDEEGKVDKLLTDKNLNLPWTVESGVNRLLDGFLLGTDTDTAAFSNLDTSDHDLLGKLCLFLEKLKEVRSAFDPSLDLKTSEWTNRLNQLLLQGFFIEDDESKIECDEIRKILITMADAVNNLSVKDDDAEGHQSSITIRLPVFKAKLEHAFGNNRDSSRYLRGKINFCSLMPMRAVPFDHIYLLGLNDSAFPRRETAPSFNLLGVPLLTRRNDRNMTIDDRFIFLEAFLSAKKSLYLSYLGESAVDKSVQNPSVVITELKDYLYDNFQTDDLENCQSKKAIDARLFRQEFLTSYDPRNYPDAIENEFSNQDKYDLRLYPSFNKDAYWGKADKDAKENSFFEKLDNQNEYLPLGCAKGDENPWNVTLPNEISINIDELVRFFGSPSKVFVKNQLGFNLKMDANGEISDSEPFELAYLDNANLIKELVYRLMSDEEFFKDRDDTVSSYLNVQFEKGLMPAKSFGDKAREDVTNTVNNMITVAKTLKNSTDEENQTYKQNFYINISDGIRNNKVNVIFSGILPPNTNLIFDFYHPSGKGLSASNIFRCLLTAIAYYYGTNKNKASMIMTVIFTDGAVKSIDFSSLIDVLAESENDFNKKIEIVMTRLLSCYLTGLAMPLPITRAIYSSVSALKLSKEKNAHETAKDAFDFDYITLLQSINANELFVYEPEAKYLFNTEDLFGSDEDSEQILEPKLNEIQKNCVQSLLGLYKAISLEICNQAKNEE